MKYIKDNYIIDLNLEILSMIQSTVLENTTWLNKRTTYIDMLKKDLNFNINEIKNLQKYFNENKFYFHVLPQILITMDNKFNIDITELDNQGFNVLKLKEFEKLVKELYLKIDINNLYKKYESFYTSRMNEIINFLKNFNIDSIYSFYGYKLGNMNIVISFITGSFGIKYKKNIYCVKSFKLDENNKLILSNTIIPFLFHEFSHPYISEIISKNIDKLNFIDNHYTKIINSKLSEYKDKKGLLEEILVRANEIYLSKKYMNENQMNIYIQKQLDYNIYYFKELVNLLETKFNNYNNYEQFFLNEIIPYYESKFSK